MRFIEFKTLQGKNFLSFGDQTVSIDLRPGVNAIIGTNHDKEDSKNGAGKSSITELLYYCLYGTTLREISKDYIQNSLTKKRCEVSLEFTITADNETDTYKIVRLLNPTKCVLYKNGEDVTRSTLAKTNALIQELIRTPSTVFQNSVIMSINNAMPFMALSKTDKRKFIESILGLEVFTQMVLKVRDDHSIAKKEYELTYTKFEQQQNELKFNKAQFENYEQIKLDRLNKLEDKRKSHENDIELIAQKIQQPSDNLDTLSSEIASIVKQINKQNLLNKELQIKLHQCQAEITSIQKQIDSLITNKDKCPTCSREYNTDHIDHVSTLIKSHEVQIELLRETETKIQKGILKITNEIDLLNSNHNLLNDRKTQTERILSSNANCQTSLKHLRDNLLDIQKEIESTTKEHNNDLKGKIVSLETSVQELETKVNTLNHELNILETVKFVISEEGIKSFLVKKILTVLNSRLAFYLKKLEANCLCQFDEFFEEKIVDESNHTKSYFNFSGGERKRIDLACLFTFADIRRLQGDVNFNTVFYDELIDSSLDDKGVQLTLKVLRSRFEENNESCYIITHRGVEVTTKAEHVIHVVKRNGISTIST